MIGQCKKKESTLTVFANIRYCFFSEEKIDFWQGWHEKTIGLNQRFFWFFWFFCFDAIHPSSMT
jgi:hypothetical protein